MIRDDTNANFESKYDKQKSRRQESRDQALCEYNRTNKRDAHVLHLPNTNASDSFTSL